MTNNYMTLQEIKNKLKELGVPSKEIQGKLKPDLEAMLKSLSDVKVIETEESDLGIVEFPTETFIPEEVTEKPENTSPTYILYSQHGEVMKTKDKEYAESFVAGKPDTRRYEVK